MLSHILTWNREECAFIHVCARAATRRRPVIASSRRPSILCMSIHSSPNGNASSPASPCLNCVTECSNSSPNDSLYTAFRYASTRTRRLTKISPVLRLHNRPNCHLRRMRGTDSFTRLKAAKSGLSTLSFIIAILIFRLPFCKAVP